MEHFYNRPDQLVPEVLEGVALTTGLHFSDDPAARILMRSDWQPDQEGRQQVAVISGGGSGHEPAHAGFIGQGMLTAAVAGDLFASPSVEAVLAAIRACCGEAGCLLVIKNYTGDRLNFGLAAERAREEGYRVASVIVADDIALPDADQPRGLAGTVLVHKVAGFHAERGDDLEIVEQQAQRMAQSVRSLGMALSSVVLPGQNSERRAPELGLGIHNEPGVRQVSPGSADEAAALVIDPLKQSLNESGNGGRTLMLINNLGGCAPQEMQVLARECLKRWGSDDVACLVGPASLMSSLDMHGFSVSVATADETMMEAITASTAAQAWPGATTERRVTRFTPTFSQAAESGSGSRDAERARLLGRVAETIRDSETELDDLDARTGDGDAGATFAAGARAVLEALEQDRLSTGDDARLAGELGRLFASAMGGSSGVLLSILMTTTAQTLEQGKLWPEALNAGIERMQHYGGAQEGDRTLLDALIPAVRSLLEGGSLSEAARHAREGADATAGLNRAGAGRSAQVPAESLEGIVDPGAEAVARALAALTDT
ncbi:dihydroxyacetone kinase subunit DhaK [Kushneria phosphatilytica]|uniref:DAK2 domain-containing protein n=1 Tax=Kushneria phosphatilytica TaxID=657387 RepID=A0A1S1NU52_9GAMM|nr:dihydroxyacetone kinase subunit DhaK [Kushneria phosphatilytica]OHV09721.1 glycerol kinase [Kushneria phosphatilytica]QEL11766.1 DAK2 domain-containing protein [Kushneria phosphatilytica]